MCPEAPFFELARLQRGAENPAGCFHLRMRPLLLLGIPYLNVPVRPNKAQPNISIKAQRVVATIHLQKRACSLNKTCLCPCRLWLPARDVPPPAALPDLSCTLLFGSIVDQAAWRQTRSLQRNRGADCSRPCLCQPWPPQRGMKPPAWRPEP